MSIVSSLMELMASINKATGENPEGVELTLPIRARYQIIKDYADPGYQYPSTPTLHSDITLNTPNGQITIKPIPEETRLRAEIKSRKEHLEQLEKRLEELL